MKITHSRGKASVAILVGAALVATPLAASPAFAAPPTTITILNINDFHGRIDSNTVKFAGTIEKERAAAGETKTLLLSAGDNVGASVYPSFVANDDPTIDVLNALDLEASAIGNHELDKGTSDFTSHIEARADFDYLAANIYTKGTETRAYDAYKIYPVDGVDVAVIGAITQETPTLVSPAGITTLDFRDPVDEVNKVVTQLKALADPPDVYIAEYHEGAPDGTQPFATELASPTFKKIVQGTDPEVDAIFTGHTHQKYAYNDGTRPIVQTGSYGENIGKVVVSVGASSEVTGAVGSTVARVAPPSSTPADQVNAVSAAIDTDLINTYPRVAEVNTITKAAIDAAKVPGSVPVGTVTADITTAFKGTERDDRASESTLGNLVADALVDKLSPADLGGAEIGVVNPGGLRAELLFKSSGAEADGVITTAEAVSVLPFANGLFTTSLTGAQFKTVLEQQWQTDATGKVPSRDYLQLGLSKNVTYTFDPAAARGSHITGIFINGVAIDPAKSYRIGTFSFLTSGGDNFRELKNGTNLKDSTLVDRDAWVSYLTKASPITPSFARRAVAVTNVPTTVFGTYTSGTVSLSGLDLTSLGSPANTSVSASFVGSDGKAVVTPVVGGKVDAKFTVPTGVGAAATLKLVASPSNTTVYVPIKTTPAIGFNVPKIDGDNKVGSTLVARTGTWDPKPVSLTYRWYRDGKAIKGATKSKYKATKADKGHIITLRVTGKKAGFPKVSKYATGVKIYLALKATPRPTITGSAKVGSTLKVLAHKWTPSKVTLSYQWYRDGVKIPGATKKSYKLVAADKGAKKVTIKVTGKKKGYLSESQTRSVTKIK